jgi:signal transduction histidine kinase/response regulator of citrate/malate metabolism
MSEMHTRIVFSSEWTKVVFRLSEVSRQISMARRFDLHYLLKLNSEDDNLQSRKDLFKSIENYLREYRSDALQTVYDMEEQRQEDLKLINVATMRWNEYKILSDRIVEMYDADRLWEARLLTSGASFGACLALEDAIDALIKFNREGTDYEENIGAKVYASARKVTSAALILISAFSAVVTIVLSRTIKRSMNELLRVSESVGEGNLDVSATIFAHDDFGTFSVQYNDTIAKIRSLVSEIENQRKEAEEATTAKSRFLASMSHEIRTPMNAIIGMSDLMRTDNLDDTQKSYFEDIKAMSNTLLQIINDILDSSKIEAGKMDIIPTDFSLRKMVSNICSIGQYLATVKSLTFTYDIDDSIPDILFGDEVRIRQILTNIMNNAIKYTPEGWVNIRVERGEREEKAGILFIVADSGMGIKKEDLPSLFEAFRRLDKLKNNAVVGAGLGLSITKKLAEMMEGTISVESEYGKGSVFSVFLPLPEGNANKAAQEEALPVMAEGANVLVVDDNNINIAVARGYLMRHGIEPDAATNGAEALEIVRKKSYDLVFMDHMMPVMDGLESITRIRALGDTYAALPIVVLSANVIPDAVKTFLEAGANDFLAKPLEEKKLNEQLARWLPNEKIRTGEPTERSEALEAENVDLVRELAEIGLDAAKGLFHTGSRKMYLRILHQASDELPDTVDALKSFLIDGNLHDYAIRVHAAKSVFATIGSDDISKAAYKLEMAAKSGDRAACLAETDALCDSMLSFRELFLLTSFAPPKIVQKENIHADELRQMLEALKEACLLGKANEIGGTAEALKGVSLNEQTDARLEVIVRLLMACDYETAAERTDELLSELDELSDS